MGNIIPNDNINTDNDSNIRKEIEITEITNVGPTILIKTKDSRGVEKAVQGFDLPFNEMGYLSMLQTRFNESEFVEANEGQIDVNDMPIVEKPIPIDPQKISAIMGEVAALQINVGKKFMISAKADVVD